MAIKKITALFSKSQTVNVLAVPQAKAVGVKKIAKKTITKKVAASQTPVVKTVAAKTTTKSAAHQKTTVSKKVKTTAGSPRLVVASDSESFWVTDGQVLNSVIALESALVTMKKSVYDYHAIETGNHFADWVDTVLADTVLAQALRPLKTAKAARAIITKHLKSAAL